jgi:hypothetical protein
MILSHKYRFIFIKTRKTAGTSLEIFLSQCCGPEDVVTPIDPHVNPHLARNNDGFQNHTRASDVRSQLSSELWDSYFSFCVERNPWDKTLSHFHMMKSRRGGTLSFERYFAEGNFCVDHPAYTEPSDSNRIIVDRVLRYESLQQELTDVFGTVGIPFSGSLGVNAKSEYRMDRRPYREVYALSQARCVEEVFAQEIALLGYTF